MEWKSYLSKGLFSLDVKSQSKYNKKVQRLYSKLNIRKSNLRRRGMQILSLCAEGLKTWCFTVYVRTPHFSKYSFQIFHFFLEMFPKEQIFFFIQSIFLEIGTAVASLTWNFKMANIDRSGTWQSL